MTIKKVAAYHEAGHVILAHLSRYHGVEDKIDLGDYGQGSAAVSLSRQKLTAASLPLDASAARLPAVANDLAVVLCAGYAAEELAGERDASIQANPACAGPDFALAIEQLQEAGISKPNLMEYCAVAKQALLMNWHYLDGLADRLFQLRSMSAQAAYDYIKQLAETDPDQTD